MFLVFMLFLWFFVFGSNFFLLFFYSECVVLFTFCLNVYRVEYENLYTWGHEEALSQMNEMSMREEELEYLWVKYNDQRNGIPTEYD